MKNSLLGIVALLSMQCAIGQNQPASVEKQNHLKRMTNFIASNKACLSGTECSPRFSLFLNYMLGAAFGLAITVGATEVAKAVGRKTGQVGMYATATAAGVILGIAEEMGYSRFIEHVSLKGISKIRCIRRGDNCSLTQRRYLFFKAGSGSGSLTAFAWYFLKGQFPNLSHMLSPKNYVSKSP